ncbi:MAG: hypothetical protein M1823_001289 [Watsoniomyces obsoletus]|nr:MAG: hypothetical protein M1823_001289 [Watsoniomyces obsoletus]
MSTNPPRITKTGSQRFSRDGFVQLSRGKSSSEKSSKDATMNIPLARVGSREAGQSASANPYQYLNAPDAGTNEKSGGVRQSVIGRRVKKVKEDGEDSDDERQVTKMGKFYEKILNFSVVTRYMVYVVPLSLLIAIPIIIGASVARPAEIGGVRIVWFFTWVEIVWLSLWVSKLFAQAVPVVFQFLCGIVSSGTRKYALVLAALEFPISLVGWAVASLATFIPLMTRNPDQRRLKQTNTQRWQQVVNNVLAACLVSTLVFFAERLLVHMISVNYHRKQFDTKIKTSKRHVHLLSLLYDASRTLFPAYCSEFAEEDYLINDSVAAGTSTRGTHQRSGSATPLRLMHNVGRVGDKITAAFGTVASEIAGKQVFNPTSAHSVVVEALEKRKSSEALARRLWMSFVVEGKDALYQEDIVEVLGSDRRTEAEEAFAGIDRDGNGDISLEEMIMTVVEFGRERHSIATSLADVDQAIRALDKLLCTIVFIGIIFVFVAFLNSNFSTTLATAGAALLSLSFVFATTAQEVLGSCIFLFVKHPYDVGDRVDINNEQLTVEHISLLFSIFKRVNTHKVVQIPHVVLNTNWIENISRSKAMREQIKLFISFDTTMEDINALKNEMQAFVLSKENSREFLPEVEVEVVGIAEMNKLELLVEVKHKSNWSNETLRATRRSKFMCALVLALRRIPIYGPGCGDAILGDVGKPTYAVAISDAEAEANRAAFAAKKEAKRLFPSTKPEPKSEDDKKDGTGKSSDNDYFGQSKDMTSQKKTGTSMEMAAMETLTVRNPAEDAARDDWDSYRENMTTPGGRTVAEARRGNDIEEVRGMLRRESTRGGRRKAHEHPPMPTVSDIAEVQTPPSVPGGTTAMAAPTSPTSLRTQHPHVSGPSSEAGRSSPDGTISSYTYGTAIQQQYYPPTQSGGMVNRPGQQQQPALTGSTTLYAFPQQQQQLPPLQTSQFGGGVLPPQQPPPQRPLPKDP